MTEPHRPRVKYVIGPDGSPLTIADLPAPGTKRWVIRRKAEVVAAVRGGLLSLDGQRFLNQGAAAGQGGKVGAGRIDFSLAGALANRFGQHYSHHPLQETLA